MIKEYFNTPIICRECNFKSISGIIMLLHLIIRHHKKSHGELSNGLCGMV